MALAEGPVQRSRVLYNGEVTGVNTSMLATAVIKGMLNPIMENEVNYVNAPGLAKSAASRLREVKAEVEDFANLITVKAMIGGKELTVQGTLFGTEGRIVRINKFRVDVDPHAHILVYPHINRPGVIGTVGTLLGAKQINISGMQVGKTELGNQSDGADHRQ